MPDRRSQIAAILEVLHDAFRRRDLDTIGRYFAEDVRLLTPDGAAWGRAAKLVDEQKVFESFDDAKVEVIELLIDGDAAAEFCLLQGALRGGQAAGRRIALRYVVRYRFEADLIVAQEICFDRAALGALLAQAE
ncbi:MAG: nuclear transport factor 2 family protein [Proteobacteria bacterium]|nr:nuclear transport factor 2 family protein [Pseudomonadota bacterium]